MIVTLEELEKAKTENGGYSKRQIKYAQNITGQSKWKNSMLGMSLKDPQWAKFVNLGRNKKQRISEHKRKQIINSFSTKKDWSWKPQARDIPEVKFKGKLSKNRGRNKHNRNYISKKNDVDFYKSKEWKEIRVRVLEKYECKCMMCGRSPKKHGIVIHVDHIKPRSKYPELSLEFNNLQILCEDCNVGKSNKYDTDWRPDEELDCEHLASIQKYI